MTFEVGVFAWKRLYKTFLQCHKFYMKNENYLNKVLRATILRVMIFK